MFHACSHLTKSIENTMSIKNSFGKCHCSQLEIMRKNKQQKQWTSKNICSFFYFSQHNTCIIILRCFLGVVNNLIATKLRPWLIWSEFVMTVTDAKNAKKDTSQEVDNGLPAGSGGHREGPRNRTVMRLPRTSCLLLAREKHLKN